MLKCRLFQQSPFDCFDFEILNFYIVTKGVAKVKSLMAAPEMSEGEISNDQPSNSVTSNR